MVDEPLNPKPKRRKVLSFYVYTHARPDGRVFYIGKGSDRRAWDFSPSRRSLHHRNIMVKYGRENIIVTTIPARSEAHAMEMERDYIAAAKRDGIVLINLTDGGEGCAGRVPTEAQQLALAKGRGRGRRLSQDAIKAIAEGLARGRANISYATKLRSVHLAIAAPRKPRTRVCIECKQPWQTISGKALCCSRKCEQIFRRRRDRGQGRMDL